MWLFRTTNSYPQMFVRFMLGMVMFAHGAQEMIGWFGGAGYHGTMAMFEQMGIPTICAFLAVLAQFFGGLGLMLGFLSRIAAFGILCNMVVAVVLVHERNGFFMNWTGAKGGEGFEYHLLAIAIAFAVLVGGAGALSVDRALMHPVRPLDTRRRDDRTILPAA